MINISVTELSHYTTKQAGSLFPDTINVQPAIDDCLPAALERIEYCFSKTRNKYYTDESRVLFDYLHTDQYVAYLYVLANTIWQKTADAKVAAKIYALNKALHGLDVFYEVNLPDIFFFSHPVGTVLGRATYTNYLIVSQGVTVGGNKDLIYPEIGEGTYLFSHSAILGNSKTGVNNLISAGTVVRECTTPDNVIVYNHNGTVNFKQTEIDVRTHYFRK